jgi:hypothetical protein
LIDVSQLHYFVPSPIASAQILNEVSVIPKPYLHLAASVSLLCLITSLDHKVVNNVHLTGFSIRKRLLFRSKEDKPVFCLPQTVDQALSIDFEVACLLSARFDFK